MKFSTANTKKPNYVEEHLIYIGTHTGSFKQIDVSQENPFRENQLEEVKNLTKGNGISCLTWSNPIEKDEILVGRDDGIVKCFEHARRQNKNTWKLSAKIVGACKFDDKIVAAEESGTVYTLQDGIEEPVDKISLSGDNISRMRQCTEEPHLIATGGKERKNNLKIIDLTTKSIVFNTKNVPNDELDLEVPVWDTDFAFLSPTSIATCSRHGYVRVYDTKKQRRPVFNYKNDKEQISYTSMTAHENLVFVGSNLGIVRAFDTRSMRNHLHTYKGFTGSVTTLALDPKGKYLAVGGLDRYVRIYATTSTELVYQSYVKSKVTQILLQDIKEEALKTEDVSSEPLKVDADPEYDELFDSMQTVEEPAEDPEETDDISERKKRKPNPVAISNRKKAKSKQ